MCKGYKKTCWLPSQGLCGTCQMKKHTDHKELQKSPEWLKLGDNFDNYAYRLYSTKQAPSETLLTFLSNFQGIFDYRIYAHNETKLCPVFSYYLRHSDLDMPMPSCLRCLAHSLRYAKDKYVQSMILRSVVMRYEDGPNMQSIIKKARNANAASLYEFGTAIVEVQGIYGVFDTYIELINNISLAVKIQSHPLLHKLLMQDELLKRRVYNRFKARKCIFYEELYAKAWHPSRFMQWCYTEGEKEGMDIPSYVFQTKGSPWNIEWH